MVHPKKVMVVSSEYPDEDHPISATFVREQATIAASDFDVAVLVPRTSGWRQLTGPGPRPGVRISQEGELVVCRTTTAHPPLRPLWLARLLLRPRSGAGFGPELSNRVLDLLLDRYLAAGRLGLNQLMKTWGAPDLVHGHFVLPGGWVAHQLARRLEAPMILTEHSSRIEEQTATLLRQRLVTETYRHARAVIAVSPFQGEQVRSVEPSTDIRVIGNPIDLDLFSPAHPKPSRGDTGPYRFFSAAHLKPRKGLDVLLRATRILVDRDAANIVLRIGGDGPARSGLESLAAELGLTDHIRFLGHLMPEQIVEAMRWADAFVLPSRRESFGVVFAEAMACGVPVIATRCGGAEFVVSEDTGILVAVDDVPALANAMKALVVGQRVFAPEHVRARIAERFSRESFGRDLGALYREVLGS